MRMVVMTLKNNEQEKKMQKCLIREDCRRNTSTFLKQESKWTVYELKCQQMKIFC